MQLIKELLHYVYSFMMFILSVNVLYHIFQRLFKGVSDVYVVVDFIKTASYYICWPVEKLVEILISFFPAISGSLFPVTQTNLWGAEIVWIPIICLFLYTAVIKRIDGLLTK